MTDGVFGKDQRVNVRDRSISHDKFQSFNSILSFQSKTRAKGSILNSPPESQARLKTRLKMTQNGLARTRQKIKTMDKTKGLGFYKHNTSLTILIYIQVIILTAIGCRFY